MYYYEFVCCDCEDKTPMAYALEWDATEVECWVCGGKATRVSPQEID